jgi:hypothetical protein
MSVSSFTPAAGTWNCGKRFGAAAKRDPSPPRERRETLAVGVSRCFRSGLGPLAKKTGLE